MVKVTFTLDDDTVTRLRQAATRLDKPQSQVVREAVHDYALRVGRLSEHERLHALSTLDAIVARKPTRSAAEVAKEIRDIRAARQGGGRRHRS